MQFRQLSQIAQISLVKGYEFRLGKSSLILLLTLLSILTISCGGGGGGGGDFIGAAQVFVDAEPTTIDPGNLMRVRVDIYHPNTRGILLKIRFPRALKYVSKSSLLDVDGQDDPVFMEPAFNEVTGSNHYLVYRIKYFNFNGEDHASLRLQLEAASEAADKSIEVDADVDNTSTFDPQKPLFDPQDEVGIEVIN